MQTGVSFVVRIVNKIVPERVGAIQGQEVIDHNRVAVHARDNEWCLATVVLLNDADTSAVEVLEELGIVASTSSIVEQVVAFAIYDLYNMALIRSSG